MKDRIMKITIIGFGLLILGLIIFLILKPKKTVCTREITLLKGFDLKETITLKTDKKKIKNISLNKKLYLSDYYDQYNSYYDTLMNVYKKSYKYLDKDLDIYKKDKHIELNLDINDKYIILNNLSIELSNLNDDTSLSYKYETNEDNESTIKIGDELDLDKLKKYNYTCK